VSHKIGINVLFIIITLLIVKVDLTRMKPRPSKRQANDTVSIAQCTNPLAKEYVTQFSSSECDMLSEGPICLFNGERVILPFAVPKGCIGYWNFDDIRPLDNSGNTNHALGMIGAGPAFGSLGASAFFKDGEYLEVPFNNNFGTNDFTITFFYYLIEDSYSSSTGTRFCPMIQRGNDNLYSKEFQRSPGLYLDRKDKILKTYVSSLDADSVQGELLDSNAKIRSQKWFHFALQKDKNNVKLYINGILDAQIKLKASSQQNKGSLYIGGVPWLKDQCNFPFLLDEFRYYNIAIDENYIQAEASPVLGSIESSFIQLGCINCGLKEAAVACVEGYHVCTSIELHTGGYQVARSMGWLSWNTHIWSHSALKNQKEFDKLKGLSLCCSDLK